MNAISRADGRSQQISGVTNSMIPASSMVTTLLDQLESRGYLAATSATRLTDAYDWSSSPETGRNVLATRQWI